VLLLPGVCSTAACQAAGAVMVPDFVAVVAVAGGFARSPGVPGRVMLSRNKCCSQQKKGE